MMYHRKGRRKDPGLNPLIMVFTLVISLAIVLTLFSMCSQARAEVVTTSQYGVTFTETVSVQTSNPVTFYKCEFKLGTGHMLDLPAGNYCTVTVQDCTFVETGSPPYGSQAAVGIWATGVQKLWVSGCTFSGLSVEIMEDGAWGYPNVWIAWNTFQRANVSYADGHGGWLNQGGWGTGVCIMHTKGWNPPDGSHYTLITQNNFFNVLGLDNPSDSINLYESTNVIVENNQITGAKGMYGAAAQSANGIVTDDQWSDAHQPGDFNWTTSGCVIQGNTLLNASIGIWAGHDNVITGNTVKNSDASLVGIGRYQPEGLDWAQSNVVSGNTVDGSFGYDDQAGGVNWTANSEF